METYVYLLHLAEFFLEWEIFQRKFVEQIKTHVLTFNNFSKNRAVYEMWKNMVQPRQTTDDIWRMLFARWITKTTDTHSE